jgi:hypothetical protein
MHEGSRECPVVTGGDHAAVGEGIVAKEAALVAPWGGGGEGRSHHETH